MPEAGCKVLVVEDEEGWLQNHEKNLRKQGIEDIITADNAAEAIALMKTQKPTGVVTDGLYGFWTKIAEKGQELGIPVALISAVDEEHEEDVMMSCELRGASFFNKEKIDLSNQESSREFYGQLIQRLGGEAGVGKEARRG